MNIAPILLGGARVAFGITDRAQPRGVVLAPAPAPPAAPRPPPFTEPSGPARDAAGNPIPRPGEVWRITGTISPSPPEGFRDQMIASYKRSQAAAGNRVVRGPEFQNGGFVVDMEAGATPSPIFVGRSVEIGPYTIAITSAIRVERS